MTAPPRPTHASPGARRAERRRRRRRALPLVAAAVVAFAGGAALGAGGGAPPLAERYLAAWARGDLAAMHTLLTPAAREAWPLQRFTQVHERDADTATLVAVAAAGPVREADGEQAIRVEARTRTFGTLLLDLRLPVGDGPDGVRVAWEPHLTFPGVRSGEALSRDTTLPPRAELQARDGTTLASGPARTGEVDAAIGDVVGSTGPIPPEQAEDYAARGYPPDAVVGLTGLELHFEERLRGEPGGSLRAGTRVLATAEPRQGGAVRTSIDLGVQRAAVAALAGRLGGIAVVRPASGEVLALAGLATAAPQPPGSVFKIVTLAGALDSGQVSAGDRYPVQNATTIEGVEIENANRESCGGTLAYSFAHSCNSVFAPMGATLGAERLVAAAERFGFNRETGVAGAAVPSIPPAGEIGDDLAVGSSAIGQGRLLSTPLHIALITAAITQDGVYVEPTLRRGGRGKRSRATAAETAEVIARYMRKVVVDGTGTAAAIEGVKVAGKTGTAELRDSTADRELEPGEAPPVVDDVTDTTAWFTAFAPVRRPRVAVAAMLVGAGAGGDTAAPAARQALLAALGR